MRRVRWQPLDVGHRIVNVQHNQLRYNYFCSGKWHKSAVKCADSSCFQCGRACDVTSQQFFERCSATGAWLSPRNRNLVRCNVNIVVAVAALVVVNGVQTSGAKYCVLLVISQVRRYNADVSNSINFNSAPANGAGISQWYATSVLLFKRTGHLHTGRTDLALHIMPITPATSRSNPNGYQMLSTGWAFFASVRPQRHISTSILLPTSTTRLRTLYSSLHG